MKMSGLSPIIIKNYISELKQRSEPKYYLDVPNTNGELLGKIVKFNANPDSSNIVLSHFYWIDEPLQQPLHKAYLLDETTCRPKLGTPPLIVHIKPYQQTDSEMQFPGYVNKKISFRILDKNKVQNLFTFFELFTQALLPGLIELEKEKNPAINHKDYAGGQIIKVPLSPEIPAKGYEYFWRVKEAFASGGFGSVSDAFKLDITRNSAGVITDVAINPEKHKPFVAKKFKDIPQIKDNYEAAKKEKDFLAKSHIDVKNPVKIGNETVLVMENLGQMDLFEFFRTNDFQQSSFEERVEITWQITLQLHQIHHSTKTGRAFIHRDIKPENILIDRGVYLEGKLKDKTSVKISIMDMGLSLNVSDKNDQDNPYVLQNEKFSGTDEYMAPEVGGCQYALNTDIYSLLPVFLLLFGAGRPFKNKNPLYVEYKEAEKELKQLKENPEYDRETAKQLQLKYNDALRKFINTPYAFDELFTQFFPDGQSQKLAFPVASIKTILEQFLKRMGEIDVTKRPDSDELLIFTTALRNLCLLKKSEPDENKEKHYLSQLILISQGLWLKPINRCAVGKDPTTKPSITFEEFFQQTNPEFKERLDLENAIVLLYKLDWISPETYIPSTNSVTQTAPEPASASTTSVAALSLQPEPVTHPAKTAKPAFNYTVNTKVQLLLQLSQPKLELVSTDKQYHIQDEEHLHSAWKEKISAQANVPAKEAVLRSQLCNEEIPIAYRKSYFRTIFSDDKFKPLLTISSQEEAYHYLALTEKKSELRESLMRWMFYPSQFQFEDVKKMNGWDAALKKALLEPEQRITKLEKSKKLSEKYKEYLLINDALKNSPEVLVLFNKIEFRNSLSTKQLVRLIKLASDKDKTYMVNQLISELTPESSEANKETNFFTKLFNWISSFNKKPKNITIRNIATEELVRLAIACPENPYFFDRLMESEHSKKLLDNKEELLKQLISSGNEDIFDRIRQNAQWKGKIPEATKELLKATELLRSEEDLSDLMGYIPIVKDDILKKIFFSSINNEKKEWTRNEKKVFYAISEEENETLKTSFSNQIQGADNVLKFYLFLLDNPERRVFTMQKEKIDITTFFLSVDRFKKIMDIIPEKKQSLIDKLKEFGEERKLTDFDEKILAKLMLSLKQDELPAYHSPPLQRSATRVKNEVNISVVRKPHTPVHRS